MRLHTDIYLPYWLQLIAFIWLMGCDRPPDTDRIAMIIDADTANEVDDLYALVRAIKEPSFDIRGITSAQFHISPLASDTTAQESHKINEDILRLMQREDIPVYLGSNHPITSIDSFEISEASRAIIREAHSMNADSKLNLIILGSCTNVASAILMDPSIISKIHVRYLGFWHDPEKNHYDKKEFNSGNDTIAVEYLLDLPTLAMDVMTATTSQHLIFTKEEVDQTLKGQGGISDYLVQRWESYERWWTDEDPEKLNWIMWDIAIIEALARPYLAELQTLPAPAENVRKTMGIYTDIQVEEMKKDFWKYVAP